MKKRSLVYCNVDYIRAFIDCDDDHFLKKLSANSNQIFLDFGGKKISITKADLTEKFRWYFIISMEEINIGFIGLGGRSDKKDFIEITGQGLTLFGIDLFYFLFSKLNLIFVKYKRVDVCFDLELEINYFFDRVLMDKFKTEKSNFSFIKTKRNGYETLYFGKKNIKENSYILNRVYNKIIDSSKKEKMFLYEMYKNDDGSYKNITRFESELREDICKFYKFEDLKSEKFIFYRLVKSFYKYNPQYFHFLKDEDFFGALKKNRVENKKNIIEILAGNKTKPNTKYQDKIQRIMQEKERITKYGNGFIDDHDEQMCKKIFVSQAKRLYRNGISIDHMIEILKNCIKI